MSIAGTPVTFAQMRRRSCAAANALTAMGVGRGDSVALFTATCPEWVYFWLGAARIGAVTAAVNAANKDEFLVHALRLARAKVVITDAERHPRLREVADRVETVESVLVVGDSLSDVLADASSSPPDAAPAEPGDIGGAVLHVRHDRAVEGRRDELALPVLRSRRGGRAPGNSTRVTCCGPPCRCSTSAPHRRYWRRCWSVGRRYCRRHSGRAKCGTRCAPAAQWDSPEPVRWSRCYGTSRRIHGTRSFR